MTVRRLTLVLIALLLGLSSAYAAACGEDDTGLISANRAQSLQENLDDLDDAVAKGQCERAATELRRIQDQINDLPGGTDRELRERLREGIENLDSIAPGECEESQQSTQTQTTDTQTTETLPPPTETVPPTETTPPPTETTPPTATTPPPTETVPPETTPTTPPETPPGGEEAPSGAAGEEG